MCGIFDTRKLNSESYSDHTRKFPLASSQGNKYIFVLYHYDTNSIHQVSIKIRHTGNIITAWEATFKILKWHEEEPNIHILDYECSNDMKDAFTEAGVKYKLVPPPTFIDVIHQSAQSGQQKIYYHRFMLVWQKVSRTRMGLYNSPSSNYAKFITLGDKESIFICICCSMGEFLLQFHPSCSTRNKSFSTLKTHQNGYVSCTWPRCMVYRTKHGTLPLF